MATGNETPRSSDDESAVPDFSLAGKKAFVTGSSRGIGRAVALALAHAGADVAISCNTRGEAAEEVCNRIRAMGRQANYYAHNVGVESEIEAMCNEVKRDFGQIDILVNN
ncbi:MAG: SDR family NAD(P)-dependent oxidoreductase, partial [Planctomycetaceae bacterium]|nr:SDR family NAD(P)-dependent oxidoreductase [Planctomycetaceae bacterium]